MQAQHDAQLWRITKFSAHLAPVAHHSLGVSSGTRATPIVCFCQGPPGSKPFCTCWAGRCPESWAGGLAEGSRSSDSAAQLWEKNLQREEAMLLGTRRGQAGWSQAEENLVKVRELGITFFWPGLYSGQNVQYKLFHPHVVCLVCAVEMFPSHMFFSRFFTFLYLKTSKKFFFIGPKLHNP